MDSRDYKLFRGYVGDLVRRSLTDAYLARRLPANLAAAWEKSASAVVDGVVDVLLPGVLRARRLPITKEESDKLSLVAGAARRNQLTVVALSFLATGKRGQIDENHQLMDGALLFCARGNKLLEHQRYLEAKAVFKRAIDIKDDAKPAWLGLAEALDKLGEKEESTQALAFANRL